VAKILVLVPGHWSPLFDALKQAGHDVLWPREEHEVLTPIMARCEQVTEQFHRDFMLAWETPEYMLGRLDPHKAVLAMGGDPAHAFNLIPATITQSYGVRLLVNALAKEQLIDGVVVTCTYDPPGRAAAVAARETNLPLVHIEHACVGGEKEYSWYMRELPGDVICVPGERDAAWWKDTGAQIEITGHPLWDGYTQIAHTGARRTLLWSVQNPGGPNALQTPMTWKYREHPDQVWEAFLQSVHACQDDIDHLIIKFRASEEKEFIERRAARIPALKDVEVLLTDEDPQDVLPRASLVVGLESNLQAEAMHLGIPCVTITQPGLRTFDMGDLVPRLTADEHLPKVLEVVMKQMLQEHPPERPNAWSALAQRYNRAAEDGKGMERTVEVVSRVVG